MGSRRIASIEIAEGTQGVVEFQKYHATIVVGVRVGRKQPYGVAVILQSFSELPDALVRVCPVVEGVSGVQG